MKMEGGRRMDDASSNNFLSVDSPVFVPGGDYPDPFSGRGRGRGGGRGGRGGRGGKGGNRGRGGGRREAGAFNVGDLVQPDDQVLDLELLVEQG